MKTLFDEEEISVRLTCGPADGKVITMDRWRPFGDFGSGDYVYEVA
jgi:hypothetical protein